MSKDLGFIYSKCGSSGSYWMQISLYGFYEMASGFYDAHATALYNLRMQDNDKAIVA